MIIGLDVRLWNQTGVGRYIRNLVENLQKIDNKNDYVIFARSEDLSNIKSKIIKPNWKIVVTNIRWHSLKEQIDLPKILNKENLDLVHFPYFSVPIFYNKPFVVTIHDLIMHHFPTGKASTLPFPFYTAKKIGYQKVINHAVSKSRRIIVPLNAVKNDLIKSLNVPEDKIAVTYEGVDINISSQKSGFKNEYGKYFMYVGNAYPHKNLDKLIEGFRTFQKNNKDVKLLLVGKDDFFYKRFENKINDSSIIFLHDIPDDKLASLYKNAIAFVSASLMEGFGLPAIEAASNSCLNLLSDIPSFREVCDDTAVYFDPLDPNSIAKSMGEVFNNGKAFYEKKIEKADGRLSIFSWEKMAEQTLKIYESCFSLR